MTDRIDEKLQSFHWFTIKHKNKKFYIYPSKPRGRKWIGWLNDLGMPLRKYVKTMLI